MEFRDFSAIDAETRSEIRSNIIQFIKKNNITKNISLSKLGSMTDVVLRDMNRSKRVDTDNMKIHTGLHYDSGEPTLSAYRQYSDNDLDDDRWQEGYKQNHGGLHSSNGDNNRQMFNNGRQNGNNGWNYGGNRGGRSRNQPQDQRPPQQNRVNRRDPRDQQIRDLTRLIFIQELLDDRGLW